MRKAGEFLFYVMFAVGISIATCSFTMMSALYASGGTWVVVAGIAVAGLACMVIAASVGELASLYPASPGIRTYLRAALGDRFSLAMVFLYLCVLFLIAGIESSVFALVIKSLFKDVSVYALVLSILAFILAINLLGFNVPQLLQTVTTGLLVVVLVGAGWLGFLARPGSLVHEKGPDFASLGALSPMPALVGMSIFLFVGFEWVVSLGRDPSYYRRLIPLSMPFALAIGIAANASFALGMGHQLAPAEIAATTLPQIPFFIQLLGGKGLYLAVGMAVLASFSTFNAGLMGSSRLLYALAREGNLPAWCGKIWLRNGSPIASILLVSALTATTALALVALKLEVMASVLSAGMVCMIYGAIMLALLLLRKSGKASGATFRSPFPAWLQWLFAGALPALGVLSLLASEARLATLGGSLLLAIGSAAFALWSDQGKKLRKEAKARMGLRQSAPRALPAESSS